MVDELHERPLCCQLLLLRQHNTAFTTTALSWITWMVQVERKPWNCSILSMYAKNPDKQTKKTQRNRNKKSVDNMNTLA